MDAIAVESAPMDTDQLPVESNLTLDELTANWRSTGFSRRSLYGNRKSSSAKKARRKASIKPEFDDEEIPPSMTNGELSSLDIKDAPLSADGTPSYFSCGQCQKIFWSESSLKHHSSLYHSEKAFVCEICCKAFRFRSNLAEHRSVHTSLKPYVCKFCGKSSRLKGNLTKHILKHHKKEQNAYIGKDDIIIKKGKKSVKDPVAVDFLEKSMIVLNNESPPASTQPLSVSNGSAAMQLYTMAQMASPVGNSSMDSSGSDNGLETDGIPAALLMGALGEGTLTLDLQNRTTVSEFDGPIENGSMDLTSDDVLPVESSENTSALPVENNSINDSNGYGSLTVVQPVGPSPVNHLIKSTQCPLCGKHFRKANQLDEHLRSKHDQPLQSESPACLTISESPTLSGVGYEIPTNRSSPRQQLTPPPLRSTSNQRQSAPGLSNCTDSDPTGNAMQMLFGGDLKELKNLVKELKRESLSRRPSSKLETLMTSVDGRVGRLEKQVEMVLNSIYTLVQLQTSMNTAFTRFRDDALEQLKTLKQIVENNGTQ